jgi:hypothetical protein
LVSRGPVRSYCTVNEKKHDITSLLGQMCPPAASSSSFGKLGPIVPSSVRWVVSPRELPVVAVSRTHLVIIDRAASLYWGCGSRCGECTGQWQRQRQWCEHGQLRGEGVFGGFCHLAGKGVLAAAMASVTFGHVGVVDGAVVPVIGVPLGQDTVSVVAVNVGSRTLATPMAHSQAVEAEPLCCCICTHHVAWTTPLDDNCRWAVDGT